jgi:hypothetical protein
MTTAGRMRSLKLPGAALALLIGVTCASAQSIAADAAAGAAAANKFTPDFSALNRDLVVTHNADGRLTMVMWMPEEFWRAAFRASNNLTDDAIDKYIAVIHPYVLIAVVDGQKGITTYNFTDGDALAAETTLEDSHGTTYKPLALDDAGEEIRNLIQLMRPLISNMMGTLGRHLEFLVFSNADKAGNPIADPKASGSLIVHVGNLPMQYRLPIGSVLPPVVDPKSGETFPGNYRFNPYTGNKLVPAAAPAKADVSPRAASH